MIVLSLIGCVLLMVAVVRESQAWAADRGMQRHRLDELGLGAYLLIPVR
jgi:uncharacterized membrane protein